MRSMTRWARTAPLTAAVALALAAVVAMPAARRASASPAYARHRLISPARCAANRAAGTLTFVSPFGYDASAGIIDVFAAAHLGYFRDLCLKVAFVTSSYTPAELVSAGRGTITGEGSAADALAAIAGGANLVGIATYGDASDYALLTSPAITNLRELEGRTVAYHGTMPVILSEMLRKAGVDLAKLDEVDDNSYDPTLLAAGRFQALQAYRSNEPFVLRAKHLAFREWIPSEFGVKGTFNVEVANGTFLRAHPSAVADFLRAEFHAFSYCVRHPTACVAFEREAAAASGAVYDTQHALEVWRFESALALHSTLPGSGVGVQSYAEWQPEASALRRFGIVHSLPALRRVEDVSLAASLYRGRTLRWPAP